MPGRVTLGLFNSYDANSFHEAMRRAVARAGPLCAAFDFNLALFGFPFHAYRTKQGETPAPRTPVEIARLLEEETSIGQGGGHLLRLAEAGRFHTFPFPDRGFPPQLGAPVLATRQPDPARRTHMDALGVRAVRGESLLVLVGLGPRGVPARLRDAMREHVDLTGREVSLETATAMGVAAGRLHAAVNEAYAARGARLTVDALVERDGRVLLVRRRNPPFEGMWALPGGFVDAGEPCRDAVLRELREETGLVGRAAAWFGLYDDPRRDPRFPTVSLVYTVEADGQPRGGDDASEARFHPLDALPELAFDHARILADRRDGHAP